MGKDEHRLLRAQVIVNPNLRPIQIAGKRMRNIRDDHRQLIPILEIFLDDVEHLAEAILGDHPAASYTDGKPLTSPRYALPSSPP